MMSTIILLAVILIFVYNVRRDAESRTNGVTGKSNNAAKAIQILQTLSEIQKIQNSVTSAGRKPFFTAEEENGDLVKISLRESFPEDAHTSRIDTFNVDLKTKIITIDDVLTDKAIPFNEWQKTIEERFP